jgi:primary-amine oxidase
MALVADTVGVAHPLDPLSADEIGRASELVRTERNLRPEHVRFVSVNLHEPPKDQVLAFRPGSQVEREAFIVLLDHQEGKTYEAVVSLTNGRVTSWQHMPDVHPSLTAEEFLECERACQANPDWHAAMRKRGITDFSLCMVEPWSAGNYGIEGENGRRITRALTWVRSNPRDNGYARPVENVVTVVDLHAMQVLVVEDYGVVPLPPDDANYSSTVAGARGDLQPIEIHQPNGTSVEVEGHEIRWQKWRFRVGFTSREGLVLHTVSYADQGRERPVLYRAALSEMVVPYGDPRPAYFRRNAFDLGEAGVGMLANTLELGCDCLGEIRYFDVVGNNGRGQPVTLRNVVCIHEEDYGLLWKHTDWRINYTEVRRSRRLVVSFIATVGNYDYGFYWYFYQDGSIEYQIKMTGVISNGATLPGERPKWGAMVAPQLYGPIHQHFFNVRLDMMVDGPNNSVYEVNTVSDAPGPDNPHDNAFHTEATLLATESRAQRVVDQMSARFWTIANSDSPNRFGDPVAYKLVPGENVLPFAGPNASVIKRAAFMTKHLWVTPYRPRERYAAGDYPNQHAGGGGLPEYTRNDEPVENTDIVVWYTFGAHHVVRPEDWPIMPVSHIGFSLKPVGFFDRNPGLDVPPPMTHCGNGHAG